MKTSGIKVKGYAGKWYVIDNTYWRGEKLYLLEHETYGDTVAWMIVNEDLEVILDEAWNGFLDLDDLN